MISDKSGEFLLKLARKTIKNKFEKKQVNRPLKYPKELDKRAGIFVTIYKTHSFGKELRGCIGLPYPTQSIIDGVIDAAISAIKDYRFKTIRKNELKDIRLEISILTEPKLIRVNRSDEYLKKIKIGRDGLIIKKGVMAGLLLPQVPVEQDWNIGEYLKNLCFKAGLTPETWMKKSVEIYRFETQIFKE